MTVGSAERTRSRARWFVVLLLSAACKKESAPTAPHDSSAAIVTDDLAAVQAELAGNAGQLQALGVVLDSPEERRPVTEAESTNREPSSRSPAPKPEPPRDLDDDASRKRAEAPTATPTTPTSPPPPPKATTTATLDTCGRICTLAGVACDLSQRICTLADQHEGDARYEDLCWNAQRQCEAASDACADCSTC